MILSFLRLFNCGDYSFVVDTPRKYIAGYLAGVTANSFISVVNYFWKHLPKNEVMKLFKQQFLTVCPLIMMQQAFYDHLRTLEDPFVYPSFVVFFLTGAVTGTLAQFLVQPFINYYNNPINSISSPLILWKGTFRNSLRV